MSPASLSAAEPSRRRPGLRTLVSLVRRRLRNREDTEHEMTPNRLAFATIVLVALAIATALGDTDARRMLDQTAPAFAAFYLTSLALFAHIVAHPGVSPVRRIVAMVLDFAMISYAAWACGQTAGFFYPLFLWTVFGNGFRFGVNYLYAATAVGVVGFSVAVEASGYWTEHHGLTVAMIVGLVILPLYAGVLIRKLSEAKRIAEEANRAKSLFLAGVSHELRTPLNAIIGFSDLLARRPLGRAEADMARTIAASGRSLLALIDDILDYSRLEAGQAATVREPVDLVDLLARVRAMLSVQAAGKGVTLAAHVGPGVPRRVLADGRHLEEVLVNLAANAVKFTDVGYVLLSLEKAPGDAGPDRLRFAVVDTGIGISAEAQGRIFDKFTQADETIIDRYGGTGLGLALVDRLVGLLGGQIRVVSAPGIGSTFYFDLDLADAGDGTADAADTLPDRFALLLVTADPTLVADIAAFAPHLAVVESIAAAAAAAGARTPDLVLVDAALLDGDPEGQSLAGLHDLLDLAAPLALVTLPDRPIRERLKTRVDARLVRPVKAGDLARLARPAASPSGAVNPVPTAARPLHILIAEDNRTNQMVIAKLLETAGHTSSTADDGEAALDRMRTEDFDLVLMDVNMPGLNGIEATKLQRVLGLGLPHLPIVGLTADATPEARQRCLDAGMDAVATKPIDLDRLLEVIGKVLPEAARPAVASPRDLQIRIETAFAEPHPIRTERLTLDTTPLDTLEAIGGPEFVDDLLVTFAADAAAMRGRLVDAVARLDVYDFRFAAHALRSASANLGADDVAALLLGWRDIGEAELAHEGERHLVALGAAFGRLDAAITRYRSKTTDDDPAVARRRAAG